MTTDYNACVESLTKTTDCSGHVEPVVSCDLDLSTGKKVSDAFANQIPLYSTDTERFRNLDWFIDEAIKQAKTKSN